jgi:hypothetical protein
LAAGGVVPVEEDVEGDLSPLDDDGFDSVLSLDPLSEEAVVDDGLFARLSVR